MIPADQPSGGEYSVDPRAAIGDPNADIIRIPSDTTKQVRPSTEGFAEYAVAERNEAGEIVEGRILRIPPAVLHTQDTSEQAR